MESQANFPIDDASHAFDQAVGLIVLLAATDDFVQG